MKIKRIFLDMDDVLNTCTRWLMDRVFKCDVGRFDGGRYQWMEPFSQFPTHVGYDIRGAVAELRGEARIPHDVFWRDIPRGIWADMPKSLECDWLIKKAVELVGQDEVYIASATAWHPGEDGPAAAECHAGKVEWVNEFLPKWIRQQTFLGTPKWVLGQPGHLLIDDKPENCDRFLKAGGDAILMPRPWNLLHPITDRAQAFVQVQLDYLLQR